MSALLGWTPFLQPAPGVSGWWWLLLLPTAVGVALAYCAIRAREVARIPREVTVMAAQIVIGIVGIAVALHLIVMVLLPHLPAE